jgi:hypothetical protein
MSFRSLRAATALMVAGTFAAAQAPNDQPAGASLQVGPGTLVDDNSTSVVDGPLSASCGLPSDDLWYYYIPTINGILFATTCPSAGGLTGNASGVPNGDTIITAFADAGGSPGAELSCNDDFATCTGGVGNGFESLMSVPVTAGVGIYLSVCGWGGPGAGGAYVLDLTEGSALANDECTGAVALVGGPAGGTTNVGLTNIGSTASVDQGTCYGQPEPDAWFVYVPVTTGVVEFSTCSLDCDAGLVCGNPGTMGNHNISVWSGACGALTQTECNSQDWRNNFACNGGQACRAQVQCTAGTPIYVAVAGFLGSQGVFDLHVEEFVSAPGNTCANAIPLFGTGNFFIDTTSDGIAPDGVNPSCNPVGDINGNYTGAWFSWTAPCAGTVNFNTCQTTGFFGGNDTVIMVYDACGGVEIACDDNALANECGFGNTLASATSFAATAGSTYFLSVGGWQGNKGPITFTLEFNYRHVWTTSGVGDIQLENVEGPGNALAFSAITLDLVHPGLPANQTFPNGWFFGVPMGFPELFQQITWPGGLPFTGILDPCGYLFNFALPAGTTTGLAGLATIWSVGVAFDPLTGFATVGDTTAPTAFPL